MKVQASTPQPWDKAPPGEVVAMYTWHEDLLIASNISHLCTLMTVPHRRLDPTLKLISINSSHSYKAVRNRKEICDKWNAFLFIQQMNKYWYSRNCIGEYYTYPHSLVLLNRTSLGPRRTWELMLYLLWHKHRTPRPFRQISSRPRLDGPITTIYLTWGGLKKRPMAAPVEAFS